MTHHPDREESLLFQPRFDENGLIPCITTSAKTGKVLMFAYMNAMALRKSLQTGEVHYWSRSRNALWHKGATSGLTQKIMEIRVDCDQDCLWIQVETGGTALTDGAEASCHTGRETCFYRALTGADAPDSTEIILRFVDARLVFDPQEAYGASAKAPCASDTPDP